MIDDALGVVHLSNISMARRARNFGANVRRMIETHMGLVIPPVNALPRNILTPFVVCNHLLNDRRIRCDELVTNHAFLDSGNRCNRSFGHCFMAKITLQLGFFDVWLVSVCDGLYGFRTDVKEMLGRFRQ